MVVDAVRRLSRKPVPLIVPSFHPAVDARDLSMNVPEVAALVTITTTKSSVVRLNVDDVAGSRRLPDAANFSPRSVASNAWNGVSVVVVGAAPAPVAVTVSGVHVRPPALVALQDSTRSRTTLLIVNDVGKSLGVVVPGAK